MKILKILRSQIDRIAVAALALSVGTPAFASSTGGAVSIPAIDQALTFFQNYLTGNFAHAAIVLGTVGAGTAWMMGEHGSVMKKGSVVVGGGALMTGAASLAGSVFGAVI